MQTRLIRVILSASLFASLVAAEGVSRPPNVVFILLDDQGATDAGYLGSRYYETPRMDQLARESLRFTNAYSCGGNKGDTPPCGWQ